MRTVQTWPQQRSEYIDRAMRHLRDLPQPERAEIAGDLRLRIDELGMGTAADLTAALGAPDQWAAAVREAMELEPWPPSSVRRRRRVRAVGLLVVLAGLVVAAAVWRAGQSDGPDLAFGGVYSSGDARFVGSVLEVPARSDAVFRFGVVVTNHGDRPVEVAAIEAFPAVRVFGSGVTVGFDLEPVIEAVARVRLLGDPDRIAVPSLDDPESVDLPVVLKPDEAALLLVAGRVAYCVDGESGSAVGFPMTLAVAVDGRYSELVATEISLAFQDCG